METKENVMETKENVMETKENIIENKENVVENKENVMETDKKNKSLKCEFCLKIFSSRQSKSEHKKKACKYINLNINSENNSINNSLSLSKLDLLEKKNIELEKENEEIKNSLNEIKELLITNSKIHPKTLQKINKNLINNNNNIINNNTTNNNNNTINNTIINKTYVNFYDPIDYKILNEKEKLNILSRPWKSLEESIKTIHFNKKFPEYKNIFITNRKDDNAYIFDGNKFSSVSKNEALNDLINSHMDEIESSAPDFEDKISETKLKHLNKFIEMINDNDKKYIHENLKKTFANYRIYKCDLIKHLIFNNSDSKLLEKLKNMDLENKIVNN
jgi:hypothetical protein